MNWLSVPLAELAAQLYTVRSLVEIPNTEGSGPQS